MPHSHQICARAASWKLLKVRRPPPVWQKFRTEAALFRCSFEDPFDLAERPLDFPSYPIARLVNLGYGQDNVTAAVRQVDDGRTREPSAGRSSHDGPGWRTMPWRALVCDRACSIQCTTMAGELWLASRGV